MTIEHLLSHRSGIGDYLDEDAMGDITDYVMPVPVHELATTEQYLAVLGGHPTVFPPGERFAYCNGGYIVLALISERASGVPFHELVRERVCGPRACRTRSSCAPTSCRATRRSGTSRTTAPRTNVFHLPVRRRRRRRDLLHRGRLRSFWEALFAGRIVPSDGSRRWCGRAATCRPRGSATASGSGSTRRARS